MSEELTDKMLADMYKNVWTRGWNKSHPPASAIEAGNLAVVRFLRPLIEKDVLRRLKKFSCNKPSAAWGPLPSSVDPEIVDAFMEEIDNGERWTRETADGERQA